jgi:hypothetical protein
MPPRTGRSAPGQLPAGIFPGGPLPRHRDRGRSVRFPPGVRLKMYLRFSLRADAGGQPGTYYA